MKLYHGTSNKNLAVIKDSGLFGGLFMAASIEAAESHGDEIYCAELGLAEIAGSYDLDEVEDFHKFFPWLSQECFEEHEEMLRAIVLDDDGVWGFAAEAVLAAFAEDDVADAGWLAQKIRGKVAASLGFKAVEMSDEHGSAVNILPKRAFSLRAEGSWTV